ncbi:MAG: c-type cytochrome, partial [Alphaproteobacteria bacterium]
DDEIVLDEEMAALIAAGDPDVGQSYIQRCTGCHSFRPEGPDVGGPFVGPAIFGVFGGFVGGVEGFEYSPAFESLRGAELEWNDARLNAFLTDPQGVVPGTAMTIRGITDAEDRANAIAFIRTLVPDEAPPGMVGDIELLQRIADADIADGELLAARCAVCHAYTEDAEALVGPSLFGVVGARVGATEGFAYSAAMAALGAEDALWTYDRIDAFLANPAIAIPGTRMGFGGIDDEENRAAIIAFLRSISPDAPDPLGISLLGIGEPLPGLTPLAFTSNQVSFGAQFYSTLGCAECHGGDLEGFAAASPPRVAPALVGEAFSRRRFGGTVFEFYDFVYQHAGSLAEIQDGQIPMLVAYLLTQSGFEAGGAALLPRDRQTLQAMGFYQ